MGRLDAWKAALEAVQQNLNRKPSDVVWGENGHEVLPHVYEGVTGSKMPTADELAGQVTSLGGHIESDPYQQQVLAMAMRMAPQLALAGLGEAPGVAGITKEAKAIPYKMRMKEGELSLEHPYVRATAQMNGPDYAQEYGLSIPEEEWSVPYNNPAYLQALEVHPSQQGTGLGTRALEVLENKIKSSGGDGVVLNASPLGSDWASRDQSKLADLVRFYEKNGYSPIKDEGNNVLMHKALKELAEKYTAETHPVLKNITSAEQAVALKGPERQAYLDALDSVYGPRGARSKEMGFDDKNWYHGTAHDFEQFNYSNANQSGRRHHPAHFFTDNPIVADEFAGWSASSKNLPNHPAWSKLLEMASGDANRAGDLSRDFALAGENIMPVRLRLPEEGSLLRDISTRDLRGSTPTSEAIDRGLKNDPYVLFKNAADSPLEKYDNLSNIAAMKNAKDIRSVNAAFDPRFADSPLLLAGKLPPPALQVDSTDDAFQNLKKVGNK